VTVYFMRLLLVIVFAAAIMAVVRYIPNELYRLRRMPSGKLFPGVVIRGSSKPSDFVRVKVHAERHNIDWSLGTTPHKMRGLFFMCFLCVLFANCEKSANNSTSASPGPTPEISRRTSSRTPNREAGPARFDVCALLTIDEVRTVAGATITQSSGSGRSDRNLRVSQCVYVASPSDQSVSLVVTEGDPLGQNKLRAKDFWRERFGSYQNQSKQEGEEREESGRNLSESGEEREGRPPRRIERLGDEAYWTAGSLYVLHNETFLRLSLGGSSSEETKLERSKALAEIALRRF
jgi:hypothetical protein